MKTYLNINQIERLAEVFANEELFTEHLKTLWALRRTLHDKLGLDNGYDETQPLFKLYNLTNELIGAIDDGTISIINGEVQVDKMFKIDR